jgi:hypothetical protein
MLNALDKNNAKDLRLPVAIAIWGVIKAVATNPDQPARKRPTIPTAKQLLQLPLFKSSSNGMMWTESGVLRFILHTSDVFKTILDSDTKAEQFQQYSGSLCGGSGWIKKVQDVWDILPNKFKTYSNSNSVKQLLR